MVFTVFSAGLVICDFGLSFSLRFEPDGWKPQCEVKRFPGFAEAWCYLAGFQAGVSVEWPVFNG